jgi:hypothetical protein
MASVRHQDFASVSPMPPFPPPMPMFGDSPAVVAYSALMDGGADISFAQIAYNPQIWGEFSESPLALKRPNPERMPWNGISFLQIAYTPSAWGSFSESPYALKKPNPERMPWAGISFLQFARNPLIWGAYSEPPLPPKPMLVQQHHPNPPTLVPVRPGVLVHEFVLTRPTIRPISHHEHGAVPPFVSAAVATPSFWSWSESPIQLKKPAPLLTPHVDFTLPVMAAVTAQVVVPFSQSLFVYRMQVVFGDTEPVFFPPAAAVFTPPPFSESPRVVRKSTPLYPWTDISFLQIAYTPGPLAFSEPQWRFVPRRPFDQPDIAFLQISYTPGPLVFSESPRTLRAPRPFEQQPWWEFPITVATPNIWGMFAESPYQIRRATPLYPWSDISFLQVAYTPGPLVFSESQWAFVKSRPFDQPGFVVLPTAVVTPSIWGMFSESQWTFKKPAPLYPWADISFLQIGYTPALWGMFSESPLAQKKPTPSLIPYVDLPTLPISLVPLVFSESPLRSTPLFQLKQFSDIAFLQITYTPSIWGAFSESPYRIIPSLSPRLMQAADIAFLQIAYTPSALVFSEPQWANRNIRGWQQRLDQPSLMPNQPAPGTPTPSALVFSESPTHVTARWMGAAMLSQEGNWGWAFPPAVVVSKVFEWHIRYRRRGRR